MYRSCPWRFFLKINMLKVICEDKCTILYNILETVEELGIFPHIDCRQWVLYFYDSLYLWLSLSKSLVFSFLAVSGDFSVLFCPPNLKLGNSKFYDLHSKCKISFWFIPTYYFYMSSSSCKYFHPMYNVHSVYTFKDLGDHNIVLRMSL